MNRENTAKECDMFNYAYIIELLTPKRSPGDGAGSLLDRFAERYQMIMNAGCGVSIPDNPMGQPRLGALESMMRRGIAVDPAKVVMNLNTFHTKTELDHMLRTAAEAGLRYILVVRGDGGPLLPKLDAKQIGGQKSVTTSMDLIRYINHAYPGQFVTGAAFNPYRPMPFESDRMVQKIDAGAKFVVTQPIIGKNAHVSDLLDVKIPVVVEAWMSPKIDLLYKSVGQTQDAQAEAYDPVDNLKALHRAYPNSCVYLSMLSFKQDWQQMLPKLAASGT
jgi:methylenetetrahydrofolate reductase (NADPH)